MKRFLSLILALIMIFTCMISTSAANPTLSVSSSKTNVNTGDVVTVSVKLSANSDLAGIKFTVKYDTSEFQYVSGSKSSGGMFMDEIDDGKLGKIIYTGISMDSINKAGTIISFKLKVLEHGGNITISINEALSGDDKDVTAAVKTVGATLKCAHSNMSWTVSEKATCTKKGVEKGTCPCGYTGTREIPQTEHSVGKYTVTKEPTCTEKGIKKAVCTICNKEYTEEIKATGHTYGKWTVEKESTETEKGLKSAVCTVCGDKKEQAIPVIGSTETTTEEIESSTENTAESTTFVEESTEENTTKEPVGNEKNQSSTTKIVVLSVLATLGVEAVIGGIIFLLVKKKKDKK